MTAATGHSMRNIQANLDFVDALADSLLACGEEAAAKGDMESGLVYACTFASVLSNRNRLHISQRAESLVRRVAKSQKLAMPWTEINQVTSENVGCLHVIAGALPAGGLTAMAMQRINNDHSH